jgi:zinc transporter 2
MMHVIGDILQSIGLLISSILIYIFGGEDGVFNDWHYSDPICTFIFSILVINTSIPVVKECIKVLMEGTPNGLEVFK